LHLYNDILTIRPMLQHLRHSNLQFTKKVLVAIVLSAGISIAALAQNVGINSTGASPDASAMLDIVSTNKGLLIPRVALTATNVAGPITSPTTSLLVYNTATAGTAPDNVIPGFYYWNGTGWTALNTGTPSSTSAWVLGGNSGTTAGTDFIGTSDDADLVFKTDNTEVMRMYSGGGVELNAGTGTDGTSAIYASGDYNNYLEINVQNLSNGNLASSDIVATADNGDSLSVYIDMGINSGGYSNGQSNILNGPNLAYIYAHGKDFKIGNGTPNRNLIFFTNPSSGTQGTNTANGEERMRITPSGNVGVGTSSPTSTLSVGGSLTLAVRNGNTAYTLTSADHIVIHNGSSPRTWTLPAANTCTGRVYKLVNIGTGSAAITLSQSVTTATGTTTTLNIATTFEIVSDGSNWIKIN
jgi:hypothetical protein